MTVIENYHSVFYIWRCRRCGTKEGTSKMKKIMAVLLSMILTMTGCAQGADSGSGSGTQSPGGHAVETSSARTEIPRVDPQEDSEEGTTRQKPQNDEDIMIIYTNDVHCGVNDGVSMAAVAALKKKLMETNRYVALVDCGDAIQGDVIGAVSDGEYIIDIMNQAGYDLSAIGNHEFDYGIGELKLDMDLADFEYVSCNLKYTGSRENPFEDLKPYVIRQYGQVKVAFVGVTTPNTFISSSPEHFKEDGEYVYDMCAGDGSELFACIQDNVNAARSDGADYVILLSHLGVYDKTYGADVVAVNTDGIDAILDAHSHTVIPERILKNKAGENVLLTQTGTKLANVGLLTITSKGNISASMISEYPDKDEATQELIDKLMTSVDEELDVKVGEAAADIKITDDDGIRMVRSRETGIGDLLADALRIRNKTDIGWINGGGIRASIDAGDVTYRDILAVQPFGNSTCIIKAKGQAILDALEFTSRNTQKAYRASDGTAIGESGGFAQVSGLKYTIDTSAQPTIETDAKGALVSISGERRVKDVMLVRDDGSEEKLDPEAEYTLCGSTFVLVQGGDGLTAFADAELIADEVVVDYVNLADYIRENLSGVIGEEYAGPQGRITVK